MYLKDYIPNINKSLGKVFFSGISSNSLKVKKDNIFLRSKGISLMAMNILKMQ